MKPKHKRLLGVLAVMAMMGAAASGILISFRQQLVFFYTPTDLQEVQHSTTFDRSREIRVGGLVKEGSIHMQEAGRTTFTITDLSHELEASYVGLLPALFREGQGVVAQGHLVGKGMLEAKTILAKHDENYMPKEVVEALKKSGRWQHIEQGNAPAPMSKK